jgi:hypothetical protein
MGKDRDKAERRPKKELSRDAARLAASGINGSTMQVKR